MRRHLKFRRTAAAAVTVLALAASGCVRQVSDVPDDDRPTPDETPIIEPGSPPAQDLEAPEESDGLEGDDEDVTDFDS